MGVVAELPLNFGSQRWRLKRCQDLGLATVFCLIIHHSSASLIEKSRFATKPTQIESHTLQRFFGIYAGVQFTHQLHVRTVFKSCLELPVIVTLLWMSSIECLDRVQGCSWRDFTVSVKRQLRPFQTKFSGHKLWYMIVRNIYTEITV